MRTSEKYQIHEKYQQAIRDYLHVNNLNMYQLAANERMSPSTVSNIHTGRMLFSLDDKRVKKIAQAIGYAGPCFVVGTQDEQQAASTAAK